MPRLLLILIFTVKSAAAAVGVASIKTLAVAGPIVGSQSTFGRVELTAAATRQVVITLMLSNPRIATAPVSVIIAPGQNAQSFEVKTEAVASPTILTLTASSPGTPDVKATFTVIPPALTILDCEPKSVSGGSRATCKVWMDGVVAAGAAPQIALSTSNAQVVSPARPTVTVPAGSRWGMFYLDAADLPQSATATISAAYAGVTKSSSLTVTPAAISNFGCVVTDGPTENSVGSPQCKVMGGDYLSSGEKVTVGLIVHITAPAPSSGYKVPLTSEPSSIGIPRTLEIPAGKDHAFFPFHTSPAASTYTVKVSAKDPITHNSYQTVLIVGAPGIRGFGCVATHGSNMDNPPFSLGCSVVGGDWNAYGDIHLNVGFAVLLTAPAPQTGYKIPLTFTFENANGQPLPLDIVIPKTLEVPAAKNHAFYPFHTEPGEAKYIIKVTAKDPGTHHSYETDLTVNPPRISKVQFTSGGPITGVPLGGKEVQVDVEFKTDPPKHGIAYDVTYSGTTDIKGPARVRIDPPTNGRRDSFTVKVFPCAVNPPCHVSVTLGGVTGTATVNP